VRDALSDLGRKAIAVAIVLVAAYILFKAVVGVVMTVVWIGVVVLAVLGLLWAWSTLARD
jgi:hypothetical protein